MVWRVENVDFAFGLLRAVGVVGWTGGVLVEALLQLDGFGTERDVFDSGDGAGAVRHSHFLLLPDFEALTLQLFDVFELLFALVLDQKLFGMDHVAWDVNLALIEYFLLVVDSSVQLLIFYLMAISGRALMPLDPVRVGILVFRFQVDVFVFVQAESGKGARVGVDG